MALLGSSRVLQGQMLLREWLYLEPQGHIQPAARTARTGHRYQHGCREGVPRVVGRVPYKVGLGPVYMRPGPVYMRARPVQWEARINNMGPESIILVFSQNDRKGLISWKTAKMTVFTLFSTFSMFLARSDPKTGLIRGISEHHSI